MAGAKSRMLSSGRRRARRKQQRILLAGTGALALALTSAFSIGSFSGVDLAGAAVAKAQSLADMFARRSPGERTSAHLIKTKHKHFAVLAAREEAEIPAPPPEKPLVEALLAPPPAALPVVPVALPAIAETAAPPIAPAVFAPVIGGGIFAPGGGGGGPGGGGPPAQPPPPNQPPGQPPATPAVPEPGTWAMMIAGFGLSGLMLRRRRRADRRLLDA